MFIQYPWMVISLPAWASIAGGQFTALSFEMNRRSRMDKLVGTKAGHDGQEPQDENCYDSKGFETRLLTRTPT
jgi:hypothetical protein